MKTLTIFRHAKSSWEFPDLKDQERPLLPKGKKRTQKICNWMMEKKVFPDLIVSSPAKRANETANLIKVFLEIENEIQTYSCLYPGIQEQVVDLIKELPNKYSHVLLVGHNPGLTDLVNYFMNENVIEWMPTSAFATLNFEIKKWNKIKKVHADLIFYMEPKNLK